MTSLVFWRKKFDFRFRLPLQSSEQLRQPSCRGLHLQETYCKCLWLFPWHIFISLSIFCFLIKISTASFLSHGLVITLPFCFLNTEVQAVVKTHWRRWRMVSNDFYQTRVKALLLALFKTGWIMWSTTSFKSQPVSSEFTWLFLTGQE